MSDQDPFAGGESAPSLSFKDAPIGTSYTGVVTEVPKLVQSRDFETGNPATWPDGNPKMSAVVNLTVNGEPRSLWAAKPSAMFAAVQKAQQDAGQRIMPGGTLTVTYVGDKPNDNPRLNSAKQYRVTYKPGDAFAEQQPAAQPSVAQQADAWAGVGPSVQGGQPVSASTPPPPPGIDPNVWAGLSAEQRQALANVGG